MRVAKPSVIKSLPVTAANTPLERRCLEKGVRLTLARRAILGVLEQATSYMTAEDVYRCILNTDDGVSVSTIYCNIKGLVDTGVIERRQFQSKTSYYTANHSEPHDRLIDIESGKVIEFRNHLLNKLKADIAQEFGFCADDCHVEFYTRPSGKQVFEEKALDKKHL